MSAQNDYHSISDFVLTISFYVRHSTQFWERLECTFERSACSGTLLCRLICPSFVDFILSFSFHYETATKAKFIFSFFTKKEWQVNLKSMKISIIVVQSFNIIVWPSRPFLKWPNLKCHVGHTCIYNTLWPTSRLITEQFQIPHWPYLFKRRKPWSTQQILFNG